MAASAEATDFLGSGPAFPFRIGKGGLPDIEFARGVNAVSAMVGFMLRTSPGEIQFDPLIGMDPENLRFDPTDVRAVLDARNFVTQSLAGVDPRVENVHADVKPRGEEGSLNISISFDVIDEDVPGNRVILPENGHDDVLNEVDDARSAGHGFKSALLLGVKP